MADEAPKKTTTTTAAPKPAATEKVQPVVAVARINGTVLPGTMFRPASAKQLAELVALNAVRDLNEAEAALFDKTDQRAGDDEIA